jgi:MshEN domain
MSTVEVSREGQGGVLRIVPVPPDVMPDAAPESSSGPAEPAQPRADQPDQPVFDMRDVPLGTLLHRSGLVTAEQLGSALAQGSRTRQRLGEVLVERGWIDDAHLSRLLAGQKGLPFIDLESAPIDLEAYKLWNEDVARERGALAIGFADGKAVVAIADPTDDGVVSFLNERLAGEFTLAVAARSEIDRVVAAGGVQPAPEADQVETTASEPTEPIASEPTAPAPAGPVHAPVIPIHPVTPPTEMRLPMEPPPIAVPPPPKPEPTPVESSRAASFSVLMSLVNGEKIELFASNDREAAQAGAEDVVRQLVATEAAGWPAVGGRFVRPAAIVSIDVVESYGS